MLSPGQKTRLLEVARRSIAAALEGDQSGPTLDDTDPLLRERAGAFVTLRISDRLRGCIGTIEAVAPLNEAVAVNAISAAFRDPRFPPLHKDELDRIRIEVSVMGPVQLVADTREITCGRDGLIIRKGGRGGLLLPQVATEQGWDRITFLRQTCAKAGLPGDAWREPGCTIQKFSAEVFGEE